MSTGITRTARAQTDVERLKKELKSIALSVGPSVYVSVDQLNRDYSDLNGRPIPYDMFGFDSLMDLLKSMADDLALVDCGQGCTAVIAITDERLAHMEKLIAGQRVSEPTRFGGMVPGLDNKEHRRSRERGRNSYRTPNCQGFPAPDKKPAMSWEDRTSRALRSSAPPSINIPAPPIVNHEPMKLGAQTAQPLNSAPLRSVNAARPLNLTKPRPPFAPPAGFSPTAPFPLPPFPLNNIPPPVPPHFSPSRFTPPNNYPFGHAAYQPNSGPFDNRIHAVNNYQSIPLLNDVARPVSNQRQVSVGLSNSADVLYSPFNQREETVRPVVYQSPDKMGYFGSAVCNNIPQSNIRLPFFSIDQRMTPHKIYQTACDFESPGQSNSIPANFSTNGRRSRKNSFDDNVQLPDFATAQQIVDNIVNILRDCILTDGYTIGALTRIYELQYPDAPSPLVLERYGCELVNFLADNAADRIIVRRDSHGTAWLMYKEYKGVPQDAKVSADRFLLPPCSAVGARDREISSSGDWTGRAPNGAKESHTSSLRIEPTVTRVEDGSSTTHSGASGILYLDPAVLAFERAAPSFRNSSVVSDLHKYGASLEQLGESGIDQTDFHVAAPSPSPPFPTQPLLSVPPGAFISDCSRRRVHRLLRRRFPLGVDIPTFVDAFSRHYQTAVNAEPNCNMSDKEFSTAPCII